MMSHGRWSQVVALVAALAGATAAAPVAAQTGQRPTVVRPTPVTYNGTVTQIDYATRVIATRGIDGQVSVFEAPPALPQAQLTAIRVGDAVRVQFMVLRKWSSCLRTISWLLRTDMIMESFISSPQNS